MYRKVSVFGIDYSVVDYSAATKIILEKAREKISFGVSALAVHGLIEAYRNKNFKDIVNKIHMVVPDGQPVRWAMNHFHHLKLKDRVYGPQLTWEVLKEANNFGLSVYFYGSTIETLDKLVKAINTNFTEITIAGVHADRFREATPTEDEEDIKKINASGAHIVLVGRGCPRQEIWVSNHIGKINAVMMAVGAAFDFHAGTLKQAPPWMQKNGMEWLFRLKAEPKRLWKRYTVTNSYFIYLFIKKKLGFKV